MKPIEHEATERKNIFVFVTKNVPPFDFLTCILLRHMRHKEGVTVKLSPSDHALFCMHNPILFVLNPFFVSV